MRTDVAELENSEIDHFPENWSKKTIEEIAIINRKNVNPTKEFPEEEFSYIDISNVESGGAGQIVDPKKIVGKEAPSRARRVIQKDDVILSTVRPYLKSYTIVPQEYDGEICSTGYAVLTAKDKTDPHFLLYSCLTSDVQNQFKRMMRGANYPALNLGHVKQTSVPYPPFTEQRKIASILTTVRDAIEQAEAVIEATRELKKSMMKHLFTYGPTPVDQADHVGLKETEVGDIPTDWDFIRLDEAVKNFFSGGTPSTKNKEYWDGEIEFTTTKILEAPYLEQGEKRITKKGLENSSSNLVPPNSILIGSRVGVGKCVINTKEIAINQDVTAAIVDEKKLNSLYLVYFFQSETVQNYIDSCKKGSTIKGVNRGDIKKLPLKLPSLKVQKTIADYLYLLDQKIDQESGKKKSLELLFDSLLKNLMTAKVRVQ